MAAEREAYRQRGELPPCDFSTPRFSSSLRPASSEPNPRSHCKQISIFSSERLWRSFWCQSWWYRAGMSYIHLIVSFIVVRECVRRLTHKLPERSLVRVTFPFEGDRPRVIRGLPALVQKKNSKTKKQPCACSRCAWSSEHSAELPHCQPTQTQNQESNSGGQRRNNEWKLCI